LRSFKFQGLLPKRDAQYIGRRIKGGILAVMRFIIIVFLLAFFATVNGQSNNPFAKLKFDKLVMYDFTGGKGGDLDIIDDNGKLASSISKQVQLGKTEANRLSSKLGSKQSYGGRTASCFDPHLGFVYYFNGKVVAHVTICLDCNRLYSSIDIPGQKQGRVGKGKDAYYLRDGMSISFRQYLNGLLKANGFSHQLETYHK
jgi:hypothetical protein